jgi:hypothetical protein
MNADEHRFELAILIRVQPRISAVDECPESRNRRAPERNSRVAGGPVGQAVPNVTAPFEQLARGIAKNVRLKPDLRIQCGCRLIGPIRISRRLSNNSRLAAADR